MTGLARIVVSLIVAVALVPAAAGTLSETPEPDRQTLLLVHGAADAQGSSDDHQSCEYDLLAGYCTTGEHPAGRVVGVGIGTSGLVIGDVQVVIRGLETGAALGYTCSVLAAPAYHEFSCQAFETDGRWIGEEPFVHECFAAPYGTMDPNQPADEGRPGLVAPPDSVQCRFYLESEG